MGLVRAVGMLALIAPVAAGASTLLLPQLRLLAEERYDDDALLRAGQGGSQLITKLSAHLGGELKSHALEADAWYAPDLLLHHGTGSLTIDQRSGLTARARPDRRSELLLRADLWKVSDPTSLPRLGVARSLSPALFGRGEVSFERRLGERLSLRPGYRFEGLRLEEPGRLPGLYHAPWLELSHLLSRRASVGLEYRFQSFRLGAESAQGQGLSARLGWKLSRQSTLSLGAGPVLYQNQARPEERGIVPRFSADFFHQGQQLELALAAGQDLAGASGFGSALWTQHGSFTLAHRASSRLRAFASASYFRNGRAPDLGMNPLSGGGAQGYALGAGAELRLREKLSLVAAGDHFAQIGVEEGAGDLARNIAAVRLVLAPF